MIESYLLVIDTGPSWKQADEGFTTFSASCTNPKLSSVLWHSSSACVGWNLGGIWVLTDVVYHVDWVWHPLQQVNSAEAQSWCSFKGAGTGTTFPSVLPGSPQCPGAPGALHFHRVPVSQPLSCFLLTTRELHVAQRDLPSTAKAAFKIPAPLLLLLFYSVLLNLYHRRKFIPLSFLCML